MLEEARPLGVAVYGGLVADPPTLLHDRDEEVDEGVHVRGLGPADADLAHRAPRTAPSTRRLTDHGVTPEMAVRMR